MDHALHERLAATELTEEKPDRCNDLRRRRRDRRQRLAPARVGTGAQVIVDVGGFLGIGAKTVALPVSQLDFMRDENGDVHATTSLTKDEAKALPEHHH